MEINIMFLKKFLIVTVLIVSALQIIPAQILDLHIKNINPEKGQLCIAVFTDEAGFKAEKTYWETKCPKTLILNGSFDLKIPLKPGKYGISVLDDKNFNGKMEYNLFGIPREGFGFSNYYQHGIFRPTFGDFSFIIEKDETKPIIVRMKYF